MSSTPPDRFPTPPPSVPSAPGGAVTAGGSRPSAAGYWIAAAIVTVGTIGAIAWFVVAIVGLVTAPDDFDRFSVPGERTLELEEGTHTLWQEYPSVTRTYRPYPEVEVIGPDGAPVPQRGLAASQTYTVDGRSGSAFAEFTAETDGRYTIRAFGEPDGQQIAVGTLFDLGAVGGLLGAIALGAVSFLVALVLFIVTLVRRSRFDRAERAAAGPPPGYGAPPGYGPPSGAAWGPPGSGAPPGYGPPGWAPPPAPTPPGWGSSVPAPPPAPTPPPDPPPATPAEPDAPGWAAPGHAPDAQRPPHESG